MSQIFDLERLVSDDGSYFSKMASELTLSAMKSNFKEIADEKGIEGAVESMLRLFEGSWITHGSTVLQWYAAELGKTECPVCGTTIDQKILLERLES
tara:strand:- start:10424 stop:10714 length:291 start_codon:yes stop_codon:yes gene_type:complete